MRQEWSAGVLAGHVATAAGALYSTRASGGEVALRAMHSRPPGRMALLSRSTLAPRTLFSHIADMKPHLGWYSRDYLPHFDRPGLVQGITFRLADSMPAEVIAGWRDDIAHFPEGEQKTEFQRRVADYLDAGHGECLLRDPRIARLVEDALLHFDGERYRLIAWVVMPNHVHALAEMHDGWPMADVVHSWKSFTAHEANRVLERKGEFWQREYHDRYIRDGEHLEFAKIYIEQNPVKARLCVKAEDWQWSSARKRQ